MENREDLKLGDPEVIEKHAEIRETVTSVKAQQVEMLEKLRHEQRCLEQELDTGQDRVCAVLWSPCFFAIVCYHSSAKKQSFFQEPGEILLEQLLSCRYIKCKCSIPCCLDSCSLTFGGLILPCQLGCSRCNSLTVSSWCMIGVKVLYVV